MGARSSRKLAAAAHDAYDRLLLGLFQGRIGKAIDATLRVGADTNVQYEALKAFTMLTNPDHFDAEGFKVFVLSYWDSALSPPLSPTEHVELAQHLDALLQAGAVGSGVSLEPTLVESVRNRLGAQSAAQRIALRLAVLLDNHPYADFTVASLGPAAAAVFVGSDGRSAPQSVPGRYTIEAYRDTVATHAPAIAAQLASETWVVGSSPADGRTAIAEFVASYGGSYARAWAALLDDLHLKPATNNAEAIQQAQALGTSDGPLALLLGAIVRETSSDPQTGSSSPIAPGDPLAPRFAALAALVARDGSGGLPLDAVMESFRELGKLRAAASPGGAPAATTTAHDRLAHIVAEAGRTPEPVHSMLLTLAAMPAGAPVETAAASPVALSRQVAARLGVPCIRLVAGRFPFARSATRDAPLEDFSRLFAPNGAFEEVFAKLLAAHVDTSSETWRPRGPGPALEEEELERFRSAARIRDVFFARGATQPGLQLTFRPLDMDQDIDQFQLEVDGQFVRYAHGPPLPTSIKWPGAQGSARIDVTPATQGDPLEFSGPWALFRLMDHAAIQDSGAPGRFRVVFDVGGRHASFEFESNSGANPFRLRELERFDCPISAGS